MKLQPLVLAVLLGVPSVAHADGSSAVLMKFTGYKARQARSAVLFKVAPLVEIVPRSEIVETAEDQNVDLDTDEGLASVVNSLGLTMVIRGKVFRRGARAKTTITITDADGRVIASGRAPSPKTRRGRVKIGQVAAKLVRRAVRKSRRAPPAALASADEDFDEDEDEDFEPEPTTSRRVVRPLTPMTTASYDAEDDEDADDLTLANRELGLDPAIDEPEPEPEPVVEIEDDEDEDEDEDDEDEEDAFEEATRTETRLKPKRGKQRKLLTATAGFTIRSRSASIGQTNDQSAKHKTGAFPELTLGLRITPFKPTSALAGAYVLLDGNYGLGTSSLERTDEIATSIYRFAASVGYTHPIGDFDVGGTLGVGHDAVTLGDNGIMGAARYTYVRIGGVGRWAVSSSFDLFAEFALRPVLSPGELGSRYAQGAGAFGVDASAGFLGHTDVGFVYGATLGLNHYALLFSAPGDLSPPVTATGGSDTSLLISTLVGWQF